MKHLKYLLSLIALLSATTLFAQIETDTQEIESEPFDELEEAERRAAAEAAKGGISVTADVRLKWIPQLKNNLGYHTRGQKAVNPVQVDGGILGKTTDPVGTRLVAPTNYYQAEGNIYLDYEGDRDWAETQFSFKTTLGIDSGFGSASLKKAWVGYSFYKGCDSEFYVELGRKAMSNLFDSRLQFDSTFDGILFNYEKRTCIGPFKVEAGPFIVDYRNDHYAWAGEAFLDEIMDTGFFVKYSLVNWRKQSGGYGKFFIYDSPKYRFVNSQVMLGYDFLPEYFGFEGQEGCIYGAWLINHAARRVVTSNYGKENQGWYVALEYGKIGKAGDYLFDICYQQMGYQAVGNFDNSSIGRGNSTARGDYACTADPSEPANFSPISAVNDVPAAQAEGNGNFRGIEFRSYYSITNNAIIKATSAYSKAKNKNIGGKNRFVKFDLQVIYDF